MRYATRVSVFLEWPFFYIASDNLDMHEKVDWDAAYSLFERELWIPLESNSDGTDGDNLQLTLMSDSIPFSEAGSYDPEFQSSDLLFEGVISTPGGTFGYMDSERELVNGTEAISLKVYHPAEKELLVLVEAIGERNMNEHVLYFSKRSVTDNALITEDEWPEIEAHCDALLAVESFTEDEAHTLFLAVNDDLYGGWNAVAHVLAHSDYYPQSWIFHDERDESEFRHTADLVIGLKQSAFEEDELKLNVLPSRSISKDPGGWIEEALSRDFVFESEFGYHRKMFVYAMREAFRVPLTGFSINELDSIRKAYQLISEWSFGSEAIEELRLHTLESVGKTLDSNLGH